MTERYRPRAKPSSSHLQRKVGALLGLLHPAAAARPPAAAVPSYIVDAREVPERHAAKHVTR